MWRKGFIIIAVLFTIQTLIFSNVTAKENDGQNESQNIQLTPWVVYWDMQNGMNEIKTANDVNNVYGSVSYFAAYFNKKDKLFIPDELKILNDAIDSPEVKYLTVVNDVQNGEETLFKDVKILKKILRNDKKRAEHADEIIKLAKEYGYNGIDLDYEKTFKDKKVAKLYLEFIKVLYVKAQENNLKMRVILEPSVNFSQYKFPQGPEYVVMMYNLYGLHSGEGPKADFKFIRDTVEKMKVLPQPVGVAFATGGCYWNDKGEKKFISTKQAIGLSKKYKISPQRSLKSNALHFSYIDDEGRECKVWYADKQTLSSWINKVSDLGINSISIWRMGGNETTYDFN